MSGIEGLANSDDSDFNLLVLSSEEDTVSYYYYPSNSRAMQEMPVCTAGSLQEDSAPHAESEEDALLAGLFLQAEQQPPNTLRIHVESEPVIGPSFEAAGAGEAGAASDSLRAKLILLSLACYMSTLALATFLLLLNSGNQVSTPTTAQPAACSFISRSRGYVSFARFEQVPAGGNASTGLAKSLCRKEDSTGRLMDKCKGVCKVTSILRVLQARGTMAVSRIALMLRC